MYAQVEKSKENKSRSLADVYQLFKLGSPQGNQAPQQITQRIRTEMQLMIQLLNTENNVLNEITNIGGGGIVLQKQLNARREILSLRQYLLRSLNEYKHYNPQETALYIQRARASIYIALLHLQYLPMIHPFTQGQVQNLTEIYNRVLSAFNNGAAKTLFMTLSLLKDYNKKGHGPGGNGGTSGGSQGMGLRKEKLNEIAELLYI